MKEKTQFDLRMVRAKVDCSERLGPQTPWLGV